MLRARPQRLLQGHTGLLEAGLGKCVEDGEAVLGAVMELTIENADKGLLPLDDVRKRVDAVLDAGHR